MRLTNPWPSNSRSNWNLEMLIFVEGGKPENPGKNPRSKAENKQQTQPTYDTGSRIRTRATLVGGERDQCSYAVHLLLASSRRSVSGAQGEKGRAKITGKARLTEPLEEATPQQSFQ